MSKRRISKQQSARIEKKQLHYRQQQETERDNTTLDGLVITRFGRHAHVEGLDGKITLCSIRQNIDSIVAGDRVVWQPECENQGSILSLYPRHSMLGRPEKQNHIKPVAANITQIMIVIAKIPEISWGLLDSYLVMADYLKIHPYIVLNKTDLPSDDAIQFLLKYYEPLGYPILFTSIKNNDDKSLLKALAHQTSVFVGQSGVGKSSLITRILPHLAKVIQTGSVSLKTNLGCHTTSNSHLYHLTNGGAIIDSPGVREFGLWNMPAVDIAKNYREFKPYLSQCKFRNCTHYQTPGCAIINAVKNKLISSLRYENYIKLLSK